METGKTAGAIVFFMAMAVAPPAQAKTYHDERYGYSVAVPDQFPSCQIVAPPTRYGMLGNGVLISLDHGECTRGKPADDEGPTIEASRPAIAIYGSWNAAGTPDVKAIEREFCGPSQFAPGKPRPGPAPAGLKIGGHNSATCWFDMEDGRILIELTALGGPRTTSPADGDSNVPSPDVFYNADLYTTAARLDADLAALRSILPHVRIDKH